MDKSWFFTATFLVAALSIPTIVNAALVGRLAATEADLIWLGNGNFAQTSGYDANGLMNLADSNHGK